MRTRSIPLIFAAAFSLLTCYAADLPSVERFSIGGKPLAEGENPAGVAVMTVYHPAKPNGAAIVIFPGGGYSTLVVEPEGHKIAKWLGEHGITGVVVQYRLPEGRSEVPLEDAQWAMRNTRYYSEKWNCDPAKIGCMGFSAGGHLASTLDTHFDKGSPRSVNPIREQSCRPDFSILIYPVITMGEKTHQGSKDQLLGPSPDAKLVELYSNEKQVTRDTPPTFLVHAVDDTLVVPENSEMFYNALKKKGVHAEYLKLPSGGHGINGYQGPMWEEWKAKSLLWLAKEKFIPEADAK